MLIDTHCHLNFQAFDGKVDEIIKNSRSVGVDEIIIPGTDVPTSEKAVAIAEQFEGIYAAVGIHPHHVFNFLNSQLAQISVFSTASPQRGPRRLSQKQKSSLYLKEELQKIKKLLSNPKVIAIGEVGIDRHYYEKTKHKDYKVDEEFVELQNDFLVEQIKLAYQYNKSLILHNREAKEDLFEIIMNVWDKKLEKKTVFHCCEPSKKLLEFAINHKIFIGVDGDIAYYKEKQEFIKTVPLEMLVLETDSPYLSPFRQFPNEPKNITTIANYVAKLKGISIDEVAKQTTENAKSLFNLRPLIKNLS